MRFSVTFGYAIFFCVLFVERIGALEAVDSQAVVVLADGIDNKKILNPKALLFRFGIYCVYLSAKTSYRI